MSTPSSIVGEQYRTGSSASPNRRSRSCRSCRLDLRGMFAGFKPGEAGCGLGVEMPEVRVDPAFGGVAAHGSGARCSPSPARHSMIPACTRYPTALVAFLNLGEQSDLGHHAQQANDEVVGVLDLDRMLMQREPARAAQPAAVLAQAGDVEVDGRLLVYAAGRGPGIAGRGVDALLIRERPWRTQPFLAGSLDVLVASSVRYSDSMQMLRRSSSSNVCMTSLRVSGSAPDSGWPRSAHLASSAASSSTPA